MNTVPKGLRREADSALWLLKEVFVMANGNKFIGLRPDYRRSTVAFFRRFHRDEDGAMVFFALMLFMMILMVGGIGVDLMRNEMTRTRLQSTLDRAVLAAADLDQQLEPSAVVQDYFDKSNMGDYLSSVTVSEGINFRTVSADAEVEVNTTLMHLAGIKTLTAPALGTAEERIENVEVSMVLDISGSMRNNNKLENMQAAARSFVDTVLRGDDNDNVSITMVPYSEHVNIGRDLFSLLWTDHKHPYSHCVEVPDSFFFGGTSLRQNHRYEQAQHYQWNWDGWNNSLTDTVCPRYDYETVTAFSRNATTLKRQINDFRPRAGTSIFMGMKWAVALLDPDSNNLVQGLIAKGSADPMFADRPKSYSDPDTLKTIILMTDGKNDRSFRISSQYYANASHYNHWNNNNFNRYLSQYVSSWQRSNWYWQKYSAGHGDYLTGGICDAAKNAGIVIWSIGFEVDDHGANVMRNCASSPSHFFRVEGIEIKDAFEAIARQINQLRLTQ